MQYVVHMASNHTASRLKPNMFITIEFTTLYTETRKGPRLSYVYIPIVHPLREGDKKNYAYKYFRIRIHLEEAVPDPES